MGDVCFSGSALALLGAVGSVLTGVIGTLFWGWIRSLQERIKEAEEQRDRAAGNFESSLHLGETAVRRVSGRR